MLDLSPELRAAGAEFLDSLRALRFEPEGLMWAREGDISINADQELGDWRLVVVSSLVEQEGPLAIIRLLHKAYERSALPQAISPFVVQIIDYKSVYYANLLNMLYMQHPDIGVKVKGASGTHVSSLSVTGENRQVSSMGLIFGRNWIYKASGERQRFAERERHFRNFKNSVNALAA